MHSVLLTTSLIETRHPSIDDANVYWEVVVKQERDRSETRFYASAKEIASRTRLREQWLWNPKPHPYQQTESNLIGLRLNSSEELAGFATDVIIATRSVGLGTYLLSQLLIQAQRVCPGCRFERA
jgi:hypothetical protein